MVGAANLEWRLVESPYTVYSGDKVLWTVQGVDEGVNGTEVSTTVLKNLESVRRVRLLVAC